MKLLFLVPFSTMAGLIILTSGISMLINSLRLRREIKKWKDSLKYLFILLLISGTAFGAVDLDRIATIESSNNPDAIGDMGRSVGLYQISQGLLKDFNKAHKTDYYHVEMRSPDQAERVARWAFSAHFPAILRAMGKKVTTERLIVCWNAGCGALDRERIPPTTRKYLRKYGVSIDKNKSKNGLQRI